MSKAGGQAGGSGGRPALPVAGGKGSCPEMAAHPRRAAVRPVGELATDGNPLAALAHHHARRLQPARPLQHQAG